MAIMDACAKPGKIFLCRAGDAALVQGFASALTVLGIVIGVSSVISMAAIIQGLNKFVQDRVERPGLAHLLRLTISPFGTDPSRLPERIRIRASILNTTTQIMSGRPQPRRPDRHDVWHQGLFSFGDSNRIISGDRSVEKVVIRGAEPEYTEAIPLFKHRARPASSALFDQDARAARSSCWARPSAKSLFSPNTDALGENRAHQWLRFTKLSACFEHDQGLVLRPGRGHLCSHPAQATSRSSTRKPRNCSWPSPFRRTSNVENPRHGEVYTGVAPPPPHFPAGKENDFELSSPDFLSNLWNQLTGGAGDSHHGHQFDRAAGRRQSV